MPRKDPSSRGNKVNSNRARATSATRCSYARMVATCDWALHGRDMAAAVSVDNWTSVLLSSSVLLTKATNRSRLSLVVVRKKPGAAILQFTGRILYARTTDGAVWRRAASTRSCAVTLCSTATGAVANRRAAASGRRCSGLGLLVVATKLLLVALSVDESSSSSSSSSSESSSSSSSASSASSSSSSSLLT